jgi:hypothetical protein
MRGAANTFSALATQRPSPVRQDPPNGAGCSTKAFFLRAFRFRAARPYDHGVPEAEHG